MKYVLDHHYAKNHVEFVRVVESDRDMEDVCQILVAIQFWYEDNIDEHSDPTFDSVIEVLCKHYGFQKLDKFSVWSDVKSILRLRSAVNKYPDDYDSERLHALHDDYRYLDMYVVRESLCRKGFPDVLYEKWLTDDVKKDLKKYLVTET